MCVCMPTCLKELKVFHLYAGGHGSQNKALNLLELELRKVVSCQCGSWNLNLGPLQTQQEL